MPERGNHVQRVTPAGRAGGQALASRHHRGPRARGGARVRSGIRTGRLPAGGASRDRPRRADLHRARKPGPGRGRPLRPLEEHAAGDLRQRQEQRRKLLLGRQDAPATVFNERLQLPADARASPVHVHELVGNTRLRRWLRLPRATDRRLAEPLHDRRLRTERVGDRPRSACSTRATSPASTRPAR